MRQDKMIMMTVATALGLGAVGANAQGNEKSQGKGKVILTTFANVHTGFGEGRDNRGFELERAYMGYEYSFNNGLSIKTVADFGKSKEVDDLQRIGYIKNAQITYKKNAWTINAGLIGTTQFKTQESGWGKRYVMKSFQDEYKFGSSADLGLSVAYKFSKAFAADVIVANGEGYKKLQVEDGLLYGLGMTLTPVDGLTLRAYGSINESMTDANKGNVATYVGYANNGYSVGAEYNYEINSGNVKGKNLLGYSVYGTMPAGKNVNLYARYDKLDSTNGWNDKKDEQSAIVGAEFNLGKYVKIAPNVRYVNPQKEGVDDSYELLVNAQFKL